MPFFVYMKLIFLYFHDYNITDLVFNDLS